ncbi:hypothetical protein C3F40_11325 [Escherichia coli]|uniref:Uncharacterized protein n=1 Tax=Escherichia coli TaxID=562 RepID=A0A7U5TJI1_ECOLX|nr:hypothetical protein C3F40_11325 [Escherichia coli]
MTLIESINVNKRTLSSSIVSNRNRRQWLDAYEVLTDHNELICSSFIEHIANTLNLGVVYN